MRGELPAKVGGAPKSGLGQQPLFNGGLRGDLLGGLRLTCALLHLLHLLQGAQGVGQQAQVMAFQGWQQGGFELLQFAAAERTLAVVGCGGRRGGIGHRA
ncbi:MAG: hypothetical protein RLZZ336_1464 [Cyanobacteriota bacterium]